METRRTNRESPDYSFVKIDSLGFEDSLSFGDLRRLTVNETPPGNTGVRNLPGMKREILREKQNLSK